MSSSVKQKLFYEGASAAATVLNIPSDTYLCPLCKVDFKIEAVVNGDLSLEHVPPESQGGKGIILTCKVCNNTAGHTIDAAVSKRTELNRFAERFLGVEAGYAGRGSLSIEKRKVNVDVHRNEEGLKFSVLGKLNSPATVRQFQEHMRASAIDEKENGLRLSFTARISYEKRLADVSDLRAAFLVCTAVMGYSFAFSPVLDRVRKQIESPCEQILPPWSVNIVEQVMSPQILLDENEGIILVILCAGARAILLPWPPKGVAGFDKMSAIAVEGSRIDLKGIEIEWPKSFVARVDRASMQHGAIEY